MLGLRIYPSIVFITEGFLLAKILHHWLNLAKEILEYNFYFD